MTVIEIEPDVIERPVDEPDVDSDDDEFPDVQDQPEPDWNV